MDIRKFFKSSVDVQPVNVNNDSINTKVPQDPTKIKAQSLSKYVTQYKNVETMKDIPCQNIPTNDEIQQKNMEHIMNQLKYSKHYKDHKWLFETDDVKAIVRIFTRIIPNDFKYVARLSREFWLIRKNNFTPVFLQVCEILYMAKQLYNTPHIIRGSAGSALVCFLLGITDIDPIAEDLCLARFMHSKRKDMPDIDIDLPYDDRTAIYQAIFKRWPNKVARISNHILYKDKSAIRDAIRETWQERGEQTRMIKREDKPETLFKGDEKTINLVYTKAAERIDSFRAYSLHCGGIVIFDKEVPQELLLKTCEVKQQNKLKDTGTAIGQQIWLNKDQVEDSGMIKIDILSNRGLAVLWECDKRPLRDYPYDLNVYNELGRGNNIGLTFAESRAMRKVLMVLKPQSIGDIALGLALIRPAASREGQKSAFLKDFNKFRNYKNSKTSQERAKYLIYDDDAIIRIIDILGVDAAVADGYRRAFSKGNVKMIKSCIYQIRNSVQTGSISQQDSEELIHRLYQLRYYSFCKSHAYSYAYLVYALAYVKYHYPKNFWLACLNHSQSSFRKWVHFREACNVGIKLQIGNGPWKLTKDKLTSVNKSMQQRLKSNDVEDFHRFGYWTQQSFLPTMMREYYWRKISEKETKVLKQNYVNIRKYIDEDNQQTSNEIESVRFKGIVACGRYFKRDGSKSFLTFMTIGIGNGDYMDLVCFGKQPLGRIVQGYGEVMKDDNGVEWVQVRRIASVLS